MKINIELDSTLKDIELVIKTPDLNNDVILIKELVEKALLNSQKIKKLAGMCGNRTHPRGS